MPKAGQVRVELNRRMTAETADWLADVYRPPTPTALGGGTAADSELQVQHARQISAALDKIARRRRQLEDFVCPVDRSTATWLGDLWESARLLGGLALLADNEAGYIILPPDVQRTLKSFHRASRSSRGRRKLTSQELENREHGHPEVEERYRKRVARRARYGRKIDQFIKEGKSALGDPDDVPEF